MLLQSKDPAKFRMQHVPFRASATIYAFDRSRSLLKMLNASTHCRIPAHSYALCSIKTNEKKKKNLTRSEYIVIRCSTDTLILTSVFLEDRREKCLPVEFLLPALIWIRNAPPRELFLSSRRKNMYVAKVEFTFAKCTRLNKILS